MTGPLAPTQLEGALSAAGHTFGCVHCHVLGHGTAMATPSLPAATTLQLSGFNSRLIHTQSEPTQGHLPKARSLQCSGHPACLSSNLQSCALPPPTVPHSQSRLLTALSSCSSLSARPPPGQAASELLLSRVLIPQFFSNSPKVKFKLLD